MPRKYFHGVPMACFAAARKGDVRPNGWSQMVYTGTRFHVTVRLCEEWNRSGATWHPWSFRPVISNCVK